MQQSHTDWSRTCLIHVVPVKAGNAGAIAIAKQLDANGIWQLLLVLLTPNGEAIAASDWLPIESPGNGAGLAITGNREALLYITDRESRSTTPRFDVPRWFSVKWRGSKVNLREIGRWEDVNLGLQMIGTPTEDGTVWAGEHYPASLTDHLDTRLVLARSRGQELPVPRLTKIEWKGCSAPIRYGDGFYLLTAARYERVELWAVDRELNVKKVLDLETRKNKRITVGPARMARCGDSLIMVWGHYTSRVGAKKPRTWQGLLHSASFCPNTQTTSEIVMLTPDTRVIAASLQAHSLGESMVVTWESRPKRGGGGLRAVRISSVDEMPCEPVVLPQKDGPLFILGETGLFLRSGRTPDASSWALPGSELPS